MTTVAQAGYSPAATARAVMELEATTFSGQAPRAITVDVPVDQVWPWLAQLGYGRAR
jgi:hypothetical protein